MTIPIITETVFFALVNGVIVLFFGINYSYPRDSAAIFVMGTSCFNAIVIAMTARVCLITQTWTWIHILFVTGSIIVHFTFFLWVYNSLCTFSPEFCGTTPRVFVSGAQWFGSCILVPVITTLLDVVILHVQYQTWPRLDDILMEIDAGHTENLGRNLSHDHVYKLHDVGTISEEYSRKNDNVVRKSRSVPTGNHKGFAFSHAEGKKQTWKSKQNILYRK